MEMSLRFAFMLVATPTACAIALWRPFWGLLCLVFLYYFRPEIWNAPQWFRPIFFITMCVAVGWATRVRTFRWHGLMTLSIVVLLGHLTSALVAREDINLALGCTEHIGKLMIVQFLVIQLVDSPKKFGQFLWANVLGMVWNTKTVLYLGLTGAGVTEDVRVDVGIGQGGGANYLAMIFVMFLPFLALKFQGGTRKERLLALGLLPLMTMCVIFTGSRSGFMATGVVMIHQVFRSNRKVPGLFAVAVIAVLGWLVTPAEHWERFQQGLGTGEQRRDFAAASRLLLWKAGVTMWKETPLLGVGPDNFSILSPRYAGFYAGRDAESDTYVVGLRKAGMVAHNTWVQTLAEGGIISAIPFTMLFVMTFFILSSIRRRIPRHWGEHRWFSVHTTIMEGVFLAFIVCAFFGSYIKVDFLWWYLGGVSALSIMASDRLEAAHAARRRELLAARLQRTPGTRLAPAGV